MGVCLNNKNITNLLLDIKSSGDNQNSVINLNIKEGKNNNIQNNKDIINEKNKTIIEKDTIKILKNDEIEENNKLMNKYGKIINFNFQSKYKSRFFNNSSNANLKNNSINTFYESINTNINKDNCDKYIYFTNLKDKKMNPAASTASNSNIKQ